MSSTKLGISMYKMSLALMACLCTCQLNAAVSETEAARLGSDLTPMGAERVGNADGSIPEWTGGLTKAPAAYKEGDYHVDPYADDQILFTITAQNLEQYRDKLSPGQIALLERFPQTRKMHVYPTRRSHACPPWVYEAIRNNATRARLRDNRLEVEGTSIASPFPIPADGTEIIWNHLLRYIADFTIVGDFASVAASGGFVAVREDFTVLRPYNQQGAGPDAVNGLASYLLSLTLGPPQVAGQIFLAHDSVNVHASPRSAWLYNPGVRRVRKAPNLAFDNPFPNSDALITIDQVVGLNGSPERYDYRLVEKREMYTPYNCFAAERKTPSEFLKPGHVDPEAVRYELHRLWVVEGTVKEGTSHIYPKRVFYIDEDSWNIMLMDMYDSRGELWRVFESFMIPFYEVPYSSAGLEAHYDLTNGRYHVREMTGNTGPRRHGLSYNSRDFSPGALRTMGRR